MLSGCEEGDVDDDNVDGGGGGDGDARYGAAEVAAIAGNTFLKVQII